MNTAQIIESILREHEAPMSDALARALESVEDTKKERDALRTALSELGVTPEEARAGVERSKAIRGEPAELDALKGPDQAPARWEFRWLDTNPHTVTSGQWSEWRQVEPRHTETVTDRVVEIQAYINAGYKYELRPLYARPVPASVPDFSDAYQGAMEEAAIWKRRALESEELNRKFIAEINGPTYMGEPVPASVPRGMVVDRGFRFDSEKQHHVPTILVEFEPVPVGSPNDAKGWRDRDEVAEWLAAAPEVK